MMRVLITAGQVYGRLDDNKLVGNRVRGIWACKFADHLAARGHEVTLLLPDTIGQGLVGLITDSLARDRVRIIRQRGFDEYHTICLAEAEDHDCAIMAAAVVNWIPKDPVKGKMATKGYEVGDEIQIPFYLAPRVIEEMKVANPKLTLIGCKMLIGSTEDELLAAAYGVLLNSRCNTVIANDMGHGLRRKLLVGKERSVREFNDDFDGFFDALTEIVEDEYFKTVRYVPYPLLTDGWAELEGHLTDARLRFDRILTGYRDRFTPVEGGRVFGSLAVNSGRGGWLVSPREKGGHFDAFEATAVHEIDWAKRTVMVPSGWNKPTLNAPLLIRFAKLYGYSAVIHLHEQIEGLPTLPYAQPGTERDNLRELPPGSACAKGFNIEGHGCVMGLKD
jgi:hypothetical protein